MISIYCARAMSGRLMSQVLEEAIKDNYTILRYGFNPLDPVLEEGIQSLDKVLQANPKDLSKFWKRDKEMIRQSNVVFDLTPWLKSEGVAHEIGYARYCLWKPVVRVYGSSHCPPNSSVVNFEDDIAAFNLQEALELVDQLWGTLFKRIVWRLKMLNRCLLKWVWFQIKEFK